MAASNSGGFVEQARSTSSPGTHSDSAKQNGENKTCEKREAHASTYRPEASWTYLQSSGMRSMIMWMT